MDYPGHRPRTGGPDTRGTSNVAQMAKLARARKARGGLVSASASALGGRSPRGTGRAELQHDSQEGTSSSSSTQSRLSKHTTDSHIDRVRSAERRRRVSFPQVEEDDQLESRDNSVTEDPFEWGTELRPPSDSSRRVSFDSTVSREADEHVISPNRSRRVSFDSNALAGGMDDQVSVFADTAGMAKDEHTSTSSVANRARTLSVDSSRGRRLSVDSALQRPRSILKTSDVSIPEVIQTALCEEDSDAETGHHITQHGADCNSSSSGAPSQHEQTSAWQEQGRPAYSRSNTAEDRYGPPPKPLSRLPVVAIDRRLPAPTLQQQMRGTRRRATGSTKQKGAGSTWQVEDFVMQPTTIDFKRVYYSPEQRAVKSRLTDALHRLRCRATTDGGPDHTPSACVEEGTPTTGSSDGQYILKNLTFRINPGSLVAVMGPSGSGKTSLLDVIAKRYTGQVEGAVFFNGTRRTMKDVKEHVGYVLQNDSLLPALTVMETLVFMGKLSLPPSIADSELRKKASDIIKELGLSKVANSQVGDGEAIRGLSGGERRRVSIGVQLLVAPGIILLDEPTTGLDSFNANQLLRTLTKLTRKQHLIMVTIHQPKSDLFRMFNDVILMNSGELIWAGPSQSMLMHFDQIGFPCPSDANPLQYFVTLSSVSNRTDDDREATEERVVTLKTAFTSSQFHRNVCEEIGWDATPLKRLRERQISGRLDMEDPFDRPSNSSKLLTLTRRALTNTLRSRSAVFTRTFQLPLLALYLLLFFTRLGNDQQSVQNRNGLILETLVEVTLASAVAAISLCPPLRERYHRETYEGMYGAGLFLLSYFLHSIPFSMVSSLLWTIVMYFGAGLQLSDGSPFFIYWMVVFLLHLVGECIAVLMLGMVSSIPVADSVTTFFIMVGIALGGGVYRVSSSVPQWLEIVSYIIPFKYSGAIMQVNEMKGLVLTCDAPASNITASSSAVAADVLNETTSTMATLISSSMALTNESDAAPACQWPNGDAVLNASLRNWQLSLGINFGALIGLLFTYYVFAFAVFSCRKKVLH
ncbi:ATP-binding cassette sub-family G member 5-like [Sycon ciliatum]|uniref:ATP-binding cassette sub-family G member 5-like n=1 Tax=Sycon ciliatum TaxID=27933 RepID=UPI0020A970DF|eukprot:scpid17232/ scgid19287/ ATP-binding cassette sub-family G member 5; Sterolin-1